MLADYSLGGRINGFVFRVLENERAFVEAGRILENCLGEYDRASAEGCTFLTVEKDGTPVAAIRVHNNGTVQEAYAKRNRPIEAIPGLEEAIRHWGQIHNLHFA